MARDRFIFSSSIFRIGLAFNSASSYQDLFELFALTISQSSNSFGFQLWRILPNLRSRGRVPLLKVRVPVTVGAGETTATKTTTLQGGRAKDALFAVVDVDTPSFIRTTI